MIESNLGVSMFILFGGGGVLSFLAYHNFYLPEDQKTKAQFLIESAQSGLDTDSYDDKVVRFRYRIGKEVIKWLATLIAVLAVVGFMISNMTETYARLFTGGPLGIVLALVLVAVFGLVAFAVRTCLYYFVLTYEKVGVKNLKNVYFGKGICLIEEKKDKLFDQIIEESRS